MPFTMVMAPGVARNDFVDITLSGNKHFPESFLNFFLQIHYFHQSYDIRTLPVFLVQTHLAV